MTYLNTMVIFVLIILGLCFGSFVNALVWRVYKQDSTGKKATDKYSILRGRSMCVNCGHTLAWYDLLPVISWISLGGKCRYCKKPISWQYPLVELLTAGLFVLSYMFWPLALGSTLSVQFGLWLMLLTGFVALAVYDLRWMILPDRIVFPMQAIAALFLLSVFIASGGDWQVLGGPVAGILSSAGVFYVLFQLSDGKWIGGGDVKLAVVIGLVVGGAAEALLMLFIASVFGSLVGIPLLVQGKVKAKSKMPFGPFLIVATIITVLFGSDLLAWYRQILLF